MANTNTRGRLSAPLARGLSILAAEGRAVFALDAFARAMACHPSRARKLLHRLRRQGWVLPLARGRYLIVPLEAGPESAWSVDSLVVAAHLAEPAAVAYWSACHYWNWTEQVPRTVFVQTTQKKMHNTRTVLGVTYRFVRVRNGKFFATVRRSAGQGQLIVTDREKTLVDALDHPELCGGTGQVVEMLPPAAEALDWDRLEHCAERLGSGAVYKRLGWLVEHVGGKARVPDRAKRIEGWRLRLTGGYAPLEPGGSPTGPTESRWRLRLNVPHLSGGSRA